MNSNKPGELNDAELEAVAGGKVAAGLLATGLILDPLIAASAMRAKR